MALPSAFLNAAADGAASHITHLALLDDTGTELSGGTYARQAVTWAAATGGQVAPSANLTFDVPAGKVGGWSGYDAATGGTSYGGADVTVETFAAAGQYVLDATQTHYQIS